MTVQRWIALRRTVRDLAASVAFYRDGLGFCVENNADVGGDQGVRSMVLGTECIVLKAASMDTPAAVPAASNDLRFQHIAIVTHDMDAAYARLQRLAPVPISEGGPQRLPGASGGVRAFKFRDLDGHPLELIEFPPGAGNPRWAAMPSQFGLTLGIDHTAISVADADRSIAFYERYGFQVAARQTNRGAAQARLDGFATRRDGSSAADENVEVEVIALEPQDRASPHLELLCYRSPPVTGARAPLVDADPKTGADCVVWRGDTQPREHVADPDGHLVDFAF